MSELLLAVLLHLQPSEVECRYDLQGTTIIMPRVWGERCPATRIFDLDPRE